MTRHDTEAANDAVDQAATGRDIVTDFAFDIRVENGLIPRYRMFENTYAVSEAYKSCPPPAGIGRH